MRADCVAFADHWQTHNEQVLRTAAAGPLWVVLGDSTAQGLGAPSPEYGYVGQALGALRRRTGLPWQVLNLSASGSLIRDVLHHQLPRLPASADLVTCGIGINDVLYTGPGKLFGDLRALLGTCRWRRCRRTSSRPGPGSSRPTASTPARTATATGPARCSPSCEHRTQFS
jgi:lysophospholipase L1-like esterase